MRYFWNSWHWPSMKRASGVFLVLALSGLLVLACTVGAYLLLGHRGLLFSADSIEWANFGVYFGGVAGPLLSFLALIAIAWTVRLQYGLLIRDKEKQAADEQRDQEKQTADQHVRWLDGIYRDILDLIHAPLQHGITGSSSTTAWAILHKEVEQSAANEHILKARLEELLKLLGQYCEAVALYRENVTQYFDAKIHQDRAARILDSLKPFQALLGNAAMAIEFYDMHLRGEKNRQTAEALHRPTRL